ncbi:hypothetical protein BH10ACT10_BH10ACT10_10760 [soil metagenome]
MTIGWVTALLDSPPETAEASERFWLALTGSQLSPRRGPHEEFASLVAPRVDPYLKVQVVAASAPTDLHLDLHTDDVGTLAARVTRLGGVAGPVTRGYVVCTSPGGLTFCLVDHEARRRTPPFEGPAGRSLVDQVCLDIPPRRFDVECAFWSALTGWPLVGTGDQEFRRLDRPDSIPFAVLLQRLDDDRPTVTAHLDLASEDRDAESSRHAALGATVVERRAEWTVLRDPAGRTYCTTDRPTGRF